MMKYYIAFFLLTGFIDDNNQLHYCNQPNDHICCKDISLYKSTMKCTNYKDCTYLTITNMISNMTLRLEVVRSTIKGGLFNANIQNATKIGLYNNTMIFMSTMNKYHDFIRFNIHENLCIKSTIM